MKTRSILAMIALLTLSGSTLSCNGVGSYPAEDRTNTTTVVPIGGPLTQTITLTSGQIFSILRQSGLPLTALSTNEDTLSFVDERLSNEDSSGTLFLFSSTEDASSKYASLISNYSNSNYIYQNTNLLLVLSPDFSKSQAEQYRTIFTVLAHLGSDQAEAETASIVPATTYSNTTESQIKDSFSDGTYVIGSIMPEGEYVIVSDRGHCDVILTEGTDQKETIYDHTFFHNVILTVKPTEVLTIHGGTAIPLSRSTSLDFSEGGMMLVGKHIQAGTYTVHLANSNITGLGTVQIMKDSRFSEDSILSSKTFTKPYKVTLKEGQYINLNGAYIS